MIKEEARVQTEKASKYLMQMCKHFAHKVPVEFDERAGRVDFQPGHCVMRVENNLLVLSCEADAEGEMARMKLILDDHLKRYAWREEVDIKWQLMSGAR
ncbi:MAG: DUF2218 domain-containing protein [Hyphomicrobiaceae bacterium]|nr:DUF2218 domain-containing protein [Hyphomicrobiaceae bacterium]